MTEFLLHLTESGKLNLIRPFHYNALIAYPGTRMKYRRAFLVLLGWVMTWEPVMAHHGAVGYDYSAPRRTLKGTVEQFTWQNPHTLLLLDVKDEKDNVVVWTLELNNPGNLVELGWTHSSLKPGDQITVTFNPAKSKPNGICVDVLFPDGRKLHSSQGCVGGNLKSFDELRQLDK